MTETVVIAKTLALTGAGTGKTILDGGSAVRVLLVNPGGPVTLQNLTITNGNADPGEGIRNDGTLTLRTGSQVTGNTSNHGGGIYNYATGTLTLEDGSVVGAGAGEGNASLSNGGGIFNFGAVTLEEESRVTGTFPGCA